jgi:hypothetical protein
MLDQARKYFGHLATLRHEDPDVLLCLSVCCAMAEEFEECSTALKRASALIEQDDVRIKFCNGACVTYMYHQDLRCTTCMVNRSICYVLFFN